MTRCDANGHTYIQPVVIGPDGLILDARQDPVADHRGQLVRAIPGENKELISAVTYDNIGWPDSRPYSLGNLPEHDIPARVPKTIIDLLEIIHVDHHYGDGLPEAFSARHFTFRQHVHAVPVPEFGQRVNQ